MPNTNEKGSVFPLGDTSILTIYYAGFTIGRTKRMTASEATTANPPASKNATVYVPEVSTMYPVNVGPMIPAVFAKKCIKPPTEPTLPGSTTSLTMAQ